MIKLIIELFQDILFEKNMFWDAEFDMWFPKENNFIDSKK